MSDATPQWPEVTSPLARRVLKRLYDSSPAITDERDYAKYEQKSSGLELQYRTWVREKLKRSSLAQQIADGPEALPDICAAMPQPLSALFRMLRPRTLDALMSHLVAYLDWYLEPQRPFISPRKIAAGVLLVVAIALFFIVPVWGSHQILAQPHALWLAPLLFVLLGMPILMMEKASGHVGPDFATRRTVNATELYWYLRRSYADSAPGVPETASQLESAALRTDDSLPEAAGQTRAVRH